MNESTFVLEGHSAVRSNERVAGSFRCRVDAWSWGDLPPSATATDGTVRLNVEAVGVPRATFSAYIHTRLERPGVEGPWPIPFGADEAMRITAYLVEDGWLPRLGPPAGQDEVGIINLADAGWLLAGRPPETKARRWAGLAREKLVRDLRLGWDAFMQDWPLQVADAARVEEFAAYYDQATDDDVRFDAMSLALYSFDERQQEAPTPRLEAWFDDRLRHDFSLFGHPVRYWSCLQHPELEPSDPEYSFAISVQMRRIYWDCLRPLALKRG